MFLHNTDKFIEFIKSINKNRSIFCCQYYDEKLEKYYGNIVKFIKTPSVNSVNSVEEIKKEILKIDPMIMTK